LRQPFKIGKNIGREIGRRIGSDSEFFRYERHLDPPRTARNIGKNGRQ